MPKFTYRVEFNGTTVKRTTDRVYTFVTVSLGHTPEREAEIAESSAQNMDRNAAYYRKILATGEGFSKYMPAEQQREQYEGYLRDAIQDAAKYRAQDPVAESQRVCEWGWSSRRDLAEKNAAKAIALGYQNVTVLEVPQP
jgi:hypothetical protein